MIRLPIALGLLLSLSSVLTTAASASPRSNANITTGSQRVVSLQRSQQPLMLTLERTACFGACPIYKLTIYGNGKVVYEGKRFVKVTGTRTTTISQAAVRQLVADFHRIHYFKLADSYTGGHTDAPSAITSLVIGKQHKTVNHYLASPAAPEMLTALEAKIDAAVNSQQWVGNTNSTR